MSIYRQAQADFQCTSKQGLRTTVRFRAAEGDDILAELEFSQVGTLHPDVLHVSELTIEDVRDLRDGFDYLLKLMEALCAT